MRPITLFFVLLSTITTIQAQESIPINDKELMDKYQAFADSIVQNFEWEYGVIKLGDDLATLNVPNGYKYLGPKDSKTVLSLLWGNPPSETLGMLFPKDVSPIDSNFTYALEISYDDDGFIKDDDAKDMDYEALLETMQSDIKASMKDRIAQGFGNVELVGWASPPHYDSVGKKLHWAKELKFEGADINTLNYNIRILGRQGYLNLNAIGDMPVLPLFKNDLDIILNSVDFNKGKRYSDFNPSFDKVAAVGIGGLIAGKVLAKVGLFAVIAKFGKVIFLFFAGIFAAFKNKLFGTKKKDNV